MPLLQQFFFMFQCLLLYIKLYFFAIFQTISLQRYNFSTFYPNGIAFNIRYHKKCRKMFLTFYDIFYFLFNLPQKQIQSSLQHMNYVRYTPHRILPILFSSLFPQIFRIQSAVLQILNSLYYHRLVFFISNSVPLILRS